MESIMENNELNLHVRSCIRVDDKLYFSEAYFNGLFVMDLKDFSISFICRFSEEYRGKLLLHGGNAIRYKEVIYFFPACTKRIHYYNFITKEENNIVIPFMQDNEEFVVSGVVKKDNKVWLFSANSSNSVFVLDMKENKITKAEALSKMMLSYKKTTNFIEIPKEGKAFTYCASDCVLLEINVEKEQIKEHKIQIKSVSIVSVNYHNSKFYFTDAVSGDLYELMWSNINLRKFVAKDTEMDFMEGIPFTNCCFADDNIYMIPCRSKHVMKINKNTGIMEQAFEYPEGFQFLNNVRTFYKPPIMLIVEIEHSKVWFYPYGSNQLLIYDTKSGQVTGKKMTIGIDKIFLHDGIMSENSPESLKYFCSSIGKNAEKVVSGDLQGKKIYQAIN